MKRHTLQLITLFALLALVAGSCRLVTNSRPGMQIKMNKYFDEDGHEYPKLDDSIFSMKMRVSGVLVPQKFVKEVGFWIFTTEPHRPGRIPVLIVHGHWSGPPAFEALAKSLDTTRFEPWFTYYPSGLDLRETAAMFRLNLARTAAYYNHDEVIVIAYSMGGLITKESLKPRNDGIVLPKIPVFIGIANPWDGSPKTNAGARSAFTADPESNASYGPETWKQVYEGSPYFIDLFKEPLPPETDFHLLYGLGGTEKDLPVPSDGQIPELSAARPEAVAQAKSVTMFKESDHVTIISDKPVLDKVNEILTSWWDKRNPQPQSVPELKEAEPNP